MKLDLNKLLIDNTYYGGDQDWYNKYFKRLAGCGPTTASTIIMYELRKENVSLSKEDYIKLMHMMWNYITPGMMGVNKGQMYIDGFNKYIKTHAINLKNYKYLHIEKNDKNKQKVLEFIKEAINNDHPVAFLNLDNGKEISLESWHWVTIIGINDDLKATICDEGYLKEIDLNLVLNTTNSYIDFIYYY